MASAFVYTSGSDSSEIRVLPFDPSTGMLGAQKIVPVPVGSGYLAFGRDGKQLYGINRTPARLVAHALDARDGSIARQGDCLVDGAAGPTHLAVHPSGRHLLTAYFGSGHASVHRLDGDGNVGPMTDLQATGREAHHIVFTADGRFVFVPCRAGDVVNQYAFDPSSGRLLPNDPAQVPSHAGAGPRHLALHPSERFAFCINELDGTLTLFALDAARGRLSPIETVSNVPPGFSERAAAHVEVHPSGHVVYASNRQHGSITVWAFDEKTPRLHLLGHETAGGRVRAPRDFTLDRGGRYLLSANQTDGLVLVFSIAADGRLTVVDSATVQDGPTFIGLLEE